MLIFSELQRRRNTIKWHQTLLQSCLHRASCDHLMSTTPCSVYRMCQRPQCESFCTLLPGSCFVWVELLNKSKPPCNFALWTNASVWYILDDLFWQVDLALALLSAGAWISWSLSSSDATTKRWRIYSSWNMPRHWLSISSNWEDKTRLF